MISIQEIQVERIDEFWNIQFQYLMNDKMITTEDEKAYFQSSKYRDVLKGYMLRTPDKLHMVYFVRDGVRIGASQYCTFKSEDGKCFVLDFWVFPEYRGNGTGHHCFHALNEYTKNDGAKYYALNYAKEESHRFWLSLGFIDDGVDEYGSSLMVKTDS
ncbi:MAG TPA: GNAT family N-acetyltransferase [Fastidiosipila sp.]|nr:GNAT family N-acetyltransferase [Fastidiosipila sp.]